MSSPAQSHSRRPAWPSIQIITPSKEQQQDQTGTDDIDEDPFSHFLSPVLDEDDPFDGIDYSAGINDEPDDEEIETKRSRFRQRLSERWDTLLSRRPKSPSKERPKSPRSPPGEDQLPDLVDDEIRTPHGSPPMPNLLDPIDDDDLDGWEADRLRSTRRTFGEPLQRPRLKTSRTLSGRKHSWTEPSPHLYTLDEHDETELDQPDHDEHRGRRSSRN